jgi:hypothetical protein
LFFGHAIRPVQHGAFDLPGCDPDRAVPVYFLDVENQLGAVVELSGKQAGEPVTVRLAPCGTATVRFVDGDGRPLANQPDSSDRPLSLLHISGQGHPRPPEGVGDDVGQGQAQGVAGQRVSAEWPPTEGAEEHFPLGQVFVAGLTDKSVEKPLALLCCLARDR